MAGVGGGRYSTLSCKTVTQTRPCSLCIISISIKSVAQAGAWLSSLMLGKPEMFSCDWFPGLLPKNSSLYVLETRQRLAAQFMTVTTLSSAPSHFGLKHFCPCDCWPLHFMLPMSTFLSWFSLYVLFEFGNVQTSSEPPCALLWCSDGKLLQTALGPQSTVALTVLEQILCLLFCLIIFKSVQHLY